jgi:hypothetical protein
MRIFPLPVEVCPEVHAGDGTIESAIRAVQIARSFEADDTDINQILANRGISGSQARFIKVAASMLD